MSSYPEAFPTVTAGLDAYPEGVVVYPPYPTAGAGWGAFPAAAPGLYWGIGNFTAVAPPAG